jgi:hypothetical protein
VRKDLKGGGSDFCGKYSVFVTYLKCERCKYRLREGCKNARLKIEEYIMQAIF